MRHREICKNTHHHSKKGGELMKKACVLIVALLFVVGYSSAAMAFHDGGVARCSGCHTMHNSQGGQLVDPNSPNGNAFLLIDSTPSDTCLSCHASSGQLSATGQTLGAGGDFYWAKTDVAWTDSRGNAKTVYGREHGHNIDAPGNGVAPDPVLTTGPGGTYNSTYLGCNSCHDPHGEDHNPLLLYGAGVTAGNYPGGFTFTKAAPVLTARGRTTTIGGAAAETPTSHTAYISGMSDWCANCHAGMHSGMTSNMVHPTDVAVGSTLSSNYDAYLTTGNMTGSQATAYLSLVPFEDATNTTTSTTGATATSKVMCLSCHRAHASPYPDAGRWDFGASLLSDSHPAGEPYLAQYSGNPLVLTTQKSLCNKCHAKD